MNAKEPVEVFLEKSQNFTPKWAVILIKIVIFLKNKYHVTCFNVANFIPFHKNKFWAYLGVKDL